MKKFRVIICLLLFVQLSSCEKHSFTRFGFDSPITEDSKGLVIMSVSESATQVLLNGQISLLEGVLELNLLNSDGVIVFSKTLEAPIEIDIDESFKALPGYWKLKYTSLGGRGDIDLHCFN